MLKNRKRIRVRVRFAAAQKEFECGFVADSTLRDNLRLLYRLVSDEISDTYLLSGNERVYDAVLQYEYDPNVSLGSNGITDSSYLIIY